MSSAFTPSVVGAFSARVISGDTTGTAVPAGLIGERISASVSPANIGSWTVNTQYDISGASVTLTPGTWSITASMPGGWAEGTGGSGFGIATVLIRSGASTIEALNGSNFIGAPGNASGVPVNGVVSGNITIVKLVTSTTTYKVSASIMGVSGSPSGTRFDLSNSVYAQPTTITATRIA